MTGARPKSVIRAWPLSSTRTFGWKYGQYGGRTRLGIIAYSFEIPMNNVPGMEVIEAFGDVG